MDRRTFLLASLLAGCGGGGSSPEPVALKGQFLSPDHPALTYSDGVAQVAHDVARFTRPIANGFGYQYAAPGARVRFWTDSEMVTVHLKPTRLVTLDETRQSIGAVLVDGVPTLWGNAELVTLTHVGRRMRLHEVLMPYNDSVDFLGVEIDGTASAAPRQGKRVVVVGDSITHGFWSSSVVNTWSVLMAQATGCEVVNLGYGGRMCVPSDGTVAASLSPDVIVYLIGYNEFSQQTTDFADRYRQTLDNIRAARPGCKVVCITPIWSPNEKPIPLESYRQAIRDSVTNETLVEGLTLTAHDLSACPDTVHPSDDGARSMALGIAAAI